MRDIKTNLLIGVLLVAAVAVSVCFIEYEQAKPNKEDSAVTKVEPQKDSVPAKIKKSNVSDVTKVDLYGESSFSIPLVSVAEMVFVSPEMKKKVDNLLEKAQGCYLLKQNPENNEILVILQNPVEGNLNRYARHNLQIAKIEKNNDIVYENFGYNGEENEIDNIVLNSETENWQFDETTEPYRPLKHTVFDDNKKVLYSEIWSYDNSNPTKYEMRDSEGKVISIMKEILDGDVGYRQEHILYDENGCIKASLTANYNGADIKWFTYYNAENPAENITIESIYDDNGLKVEEKIYNQDYRLIKTLTADYKDGQRVQLKVNGADGKEISTFEN